jgi:hypothetical protein
MEEQDFPLLTRRERMYATVYAHPGFTSPMKQARNERST